MRYFRATNVEGGFTIALSLHSSTRFGPFAGWLEDLVGIRTANELLADVGRVEGDEFVIRVLDWLRISVLVDICEPLPSGAFIVVSNHPHGAIDGLALLKHVSETRRDTKLVVNRLVTQIENLKNKVIGVDQPSKPNRTGFGVRGMFRHLENGKPLILFPAGWVASHTNGGIAVDDPWHPSVCRLIQRYRVPVVPALIKGGNSRSFYHIRKVSRSVGSMLLLREMFLAQQSTVQIALGQTILYKDLKEKDDSAIIDVIRESVYKLAQTRLEPTVNLP